MGWIHFNADGGDIGGRITITGDVAKLIQTAVACFGRIFKTAVGKQSDVAVIGWIDEHRR